MPSKKPYRRSSTGVRRPLKKGAAAKLARESRPKLVVVAPADRPTPMQRLDVNPAFRFTSWSPSRLADYLTCPYMAFCKHLRKLCTSCYQGKFRGGYSTPAVCERCGYTQVKAYALTRGDEIGKQQDLYVTGKGNLHPEITNPVVKQLSLDARKAFADKRARVQVDIQVDDAWNVVVSKFYNPCVWARFKLDYLEFTSKTSVRIVDWKTGGIDKMTGAVRDDDKYDDQLLSYSTAVLLAYPEIMEVESELVFLDCGDRYDPVVRRDRSSLVRGQLGVALGYWKTRISPMLRDVEFAPRPNPSCSYCSYSHRRKGEMNFGPCKF